MQHHKVINYSQKHFQQVKKSKMRSSLRSSKARNEVGFLGLVILIIGISICIPKIASSENSISKDEQKKLRFNKNGEFKILQISDMHYANGKDTPCADVLPSQMDTCSDLNTTDYLRRFIQMEKPDLIVFTGNIYFPSFFSHVSIISTYLFSV